MKPRSLRHDLIALAITACAGLATLPAFAAGVLSSPVSITLTAPGGFTDGTTASTAPILLSDTVATATGIQPGDGSSIGGFMLVGEHISFGGASNDISLRVAAGADTNGVLSSGHLGLPGEHARYIFTGLAISGETIVGFTATKAGLTSPLLVSDFIHLLSPSSLAIDLDELIFANDPRGALFSGVDLVIDLLTRPTPVVTDVPEPGSLALALAALAALSARRRRSAVADRN